MEGAQLLPNRNGCAPFLPSGKGTKFEKQVVFQTAFVPCKAYIKLCIFFASQRKSAQMHTPKKGMVKTMKRILSVILTVTCILSLLAVIPLSAFAEGERVGYTVTLITKKSDVTALNDIKNGLIAISNCRFQGDP